MTQRLNRIKAKQAILYASYKLANEKSFGSTVLNKILYYSDHAHYIQTGKTITGFGYVKQVNGPTPDPKEFLPLKREMLGNREIREEEIQYFGKIQKRCVPIHQPNVTCFTPQEIALMDEIIEAFVGVSAKAASDMTHSEIAWKFAQPMEELPPFVCLLTESTLNNEDIVWATSIIQAHHRTSSVKPHLTKN